MNEARGIDTRAGFRQAVLDALAAALERGAREMWWVDASFAAWPLDDPALIESLDRWVHLPQRRLQLFTHDFTALARAHPRFVQWRRHWSHCVLGRRPLDIEPAAIETLLLTDAATLLVLHDPSRFRGVLSQSGIEAGQARLRVDAITQRSEEAFTTVVLGI